jgi:hypothetical protein
MTSLRRAFLFFVVTSWCLALEGCFFDADRPPSRPPAPASEPGPSCTPGTPPEITGLDMPPSADVGPTGDYEITGRIRYEEHGCAVLTRVVHTADESESRSPATRADGDETLTVRFAAADKGQSPWYQVSVIDSLGQESTRLTEHIDLR